MAPSLFWLGREIGMEGARDLAQEMERKGEGKVLDQFNNPDNPRAHFTQLDLKFGNRLKGALPILFLAWEQQVR